MTLDPTVCRVRAEALIWIAMLTDPDFDPGGRYPTMRERLAAFREWFSRSLLHFRIFMEMLELSQRDFEDYAPLDACVREQMHRTYDNIIPFDRKTRSRTRIGLTDTRADPEPTAPPTPAPAS
ncbi:MAG TPA: hypothetical protein VLX90_10485 [Steroidobacteraceae bacterium]|nr:hypothetical protein [Steroidobacteraceae bacterium]